MRESGLHLPRINARMRLGLVAYGIILLLWLSVEDKGALSVAWLGSGATLFFGMVALLERIGGRVVTVRAYLTLCFIWGAILGAGATLTIAALMFFKSAWHAHLVPDYPLPMIAAMLGRFPIWMLAGSLLGLSVGLMRLVVHNPDQK